MESGRQPFGKTFLPGSTTLQRYCDQNDGVRIYRIDQKDGAAGLLERDAVDGNHIVIKKSGSGAPQVRALDGGVTIDITSCGPEVGSIERARRIPATKKGTESGMTCGPNLSS